MGEFFYSYGLFLLKAVTVLVTLVLLMVLCAAIAGRARRGGEGDNQKGQLQVSRMNTLLSDMEDTLNDSMLEPDERKVAIEQRKEEEKASNRGNRGLKRWLRRWRGQGETRLAESSRRRLFVLDFDGDIRATDVSKLRREITAILTTARRDDEVVLRLESGGGMVTGYGLAAAQLERIKDKRIPLTICVDKVAASGGYMMACVGNKVLAAPFAVLGSIGVVAQIPNVHRLLKEHNIDFETLTAGRYKRTMTVFGENTDEHRRKFMEDLERIHQQFKEFVAKHRPQLDIEAVSTGEIWSGNDLLELSLADALNTSDQYLVDACRDRDVFLIEYKPRKKLFERLSLGVQETVDGVMLRWLDRTLSRHSNLF